MRKIMHISDLHIGKRVNEFNLLEDQEFILNKIIDIACENSVDTVIIAGDIYDKPVPSAEAVTVFDCFLSSLVKQGIKVFAVSGNHDSPERINFAKNIMSGAGVHMAGVFGGEVEYVDDGEVVFYMLPFIKPSRVKMFYPDDEILSYNDAVKKVMEDIEIDKNKINILIAHQFVTSVGLELETCESESRSVGGVDSVDASLFEKFDYVALGHLHNPQSTGRREIRYSGAPLEYSFNEREKSVTLITADKTVEIDEVLLIPMRKMRVIKGPIEKILSHENVSDTNDYICAILTDDDVVDAAARIRSVYPNMMTINFDNSKTEAELDFDDCGEEGNLFELFCEFYFKQNGRHMSNEQIDLVRDIFEEVYSETDIS